jgi:hypothetical protein
VAGAALQACAAALPAGADPAVANLDAAGRWTAVLRWDEKTTAVAVCQLAPGRWSSERAIRDTDVAWPGRALEARVPNEGSQVPALADALRGLVFVALRGEPAHDIAVWVRYAGAVEPARAGKALAFDVHVQAKTSDAGMCHRWTMDVDLSGRLLLRAGDGSLEQLELHGPRRDTEALCPDVAPGASAGPRTCNEGQETIQVRRAP